MGVIEGEMHAMKHGRFETLAAFCGAMEWTADPETIYQRIVDVSSEYFECDSAHLHLIDIDGKRFVKYASHDELVESAVAQVTVTPSVGRMANLLNFGELIVMDYEHPHEKDVIPDAAIELGYRSAVSIPLSSSSGVLGMLSVVFAEELPFAEDDFDFLLEIGRILGTLVQRVQMSKKDLEFKMLKERKQLSSEIHDNISQMVSALAIRADIASSCLDDGDLDALDSEIDAISVQARQVTKVLREEMISLRTPIEGAGDVGADLAEILDRFEGQWGIGVLLTVRGDECIVVSEYARLQLARIFNECLQNVLRHSRATQVQVVIGRKNNRVLISISDNGVGFDIARVAPERLGIKIMRERAASAGGKVSVASGSQGTTVFIEMPVVR
ncbi:MAG TPA: hypothetical protein DCP91_02510 [Eggerthellaceae bacterium]|nr:hypothetical protein [Eggerthellaceae bacterium]